MNKQRLIDANELERRVTAIAVAQSNNKIRLVKAICERWKKKLQICSYRAVRIEYMRKLYAAEIEQRGCHYCESVC